MQNFTSDPLSTQTFSTFQHVREFAVGCKETVARACRVPLGLCGGLAGRSADLRHSGRLASCLLRPASSNCISPDDDTPHHALILSCRNAAGSVASHCNRRNQRVLQSKVVPAENGSDVFKCTTQEGVVHSFWNLGKSTLMFAALLCSPCCLLPTASASCTSPEDDTPHHAMTLSLWSAADWVAKSM